MHTVSKIACSLLLIGSSSAIWAQEKAEQSAALVELDPVKQEMVAEQVWVPGTVISRTDSNIASEVAGRISWIADVGDLVEKGQVLAKLNDELLLLDKQQHLANIAKWQSRVELLQRKQKRFQTMAKKNATSRDQLDEVISDLEIAKQELAQAKVNKLQTEYQLSQTLVKAPFNAMVVDRLQTPGEYTTVGKDLLRVVDTQNVEASIRAPLSVLPFVEQGMPVLVKHRQQQKQEVIRAIVPVGNARSRMMEVRVALNPGDFAIGSAVRVALPNSEYHQATTVKRDALVLRQTGTFVYVIDSEDQAQQISVRTGIGVGERIEVMGELNNGHNVVIRGAERLRPGQKVRYQQPAKALAALSN